MNNIWTGDQAVLTKVNELCMNTDGYVEPPQVLDAFPEERREAVLRSLRRLGDHGYINTVTTQAMGDPGPQILLIKGVTEKGLQAVGAYPAQAAQALLATVDEAIENAPDAEERTKLQALGSGFAGLSLNTASGLATLLIAKFTGLA
jgi:hypothetical protein